MIIQGKNIEIITSEADGIRIGTLVSDELLVPDIRSGIDFLVDIYYQGYDKIILDEKNVNPLFFDLKSGFAGEILQTISNFRIQLAIAGDYSKYSSKSLNSFIKESNRGGAINFIDRLD